MGTFFLTPNNGHFLSYTQQWALSFLHPTIKQSNTHDFTSFSSQRSILPVA